MPWNLTEEEVASLMKVIPPVCSPYYVDKETTIKFLNDETGEYEDRPITLHNEISDDAPQAIKDLDNAYMDIIEKGAVIGGRDLMSGEG